MKITKVTVAVLKDKPRLRGVASVVFDDVFKVRDIPILPRKNDDCLYVAMPGKKLSDGHRIYYAYPVTQEFRTEIETAILEEYNRRLTEGGISENDIDGKTEDDESEEE